MSARTVLYLEDSESDVFFMRRACDRAGLAFHLDVVGDGRAAIEYLSDSLDTPPRGPIPCLILLDLCVPVLDGFGVLEWIRAQPRLASVPVVVFSASHLDVDKARAFDLGATEYVTKPNDLTSLPAILCDLEARFCPR